MIDGLTIRKGEEEDFESVYEIESICYDFPWGSGEFYDDFVWNRRGYWIVAEIKNQVIGFAGIWFKLGEFHIVNLAVLPEKRRMGIGNALVSELISFAKKSKGRYIFLEVEDENTNAIELYKGFGFRVIRRIEGYYAENGKSALLMIKELNK